MRHDCSVRAEDLGPYLLGQLSDIEAAGLKHDIDACPSCTAEVERLRPVVVALALATAPSEDAAVTAPVPALDRVLHSVRTEQAAIRRRRRTTAIAVAASLVLLLGA